MNAPKYISVIILSMVALVSHAGTTIPVDAASGEVVYRQQFKIHPNFTDEDAYALVQDWFNNAEKFTCKNGDCPNVTCKNKTIVEEEFNNSQPLQSLDPVSHRIMGKGLIKYLGGPASTINLLYMEYYVVLQISGHQLTATISKITYHHFNRNTYLAKPIYGWQGGRPYDAADKLENLVNAQSNSNDIQQLGSFVNKNMENLFIDLKSFLQSKKVLS